LLMAAVLAAISHAAAAVNSPQDSSSLSFTETTTANYLVTTSGQVQVDFNSVQLDTSSPQAYAFGVDARTSQDFTITRLHWEFGDGVFLDVPYCCESQVSEVRYHAYQQPGTYTVLVVAYDNGGNYGEALVTISWPTPIPEFPSTAAPLLASIMILLTAAALVQKRSPLRRSLPL
jgi:hypothetical protein